MAKANIPRISSQVRQILDRELGSHAQGHVSLDIKAERGRFHRGEHALKKYRVLESVPTYALTMARAARSGLSGPERSGSTLLIEWFSGLLGKVEIHEKKGQPALTRVSTGVLALDFEKLVRRIRGRSVRRRASAAEIRILAVPGIHLLCLWKHWSKTPGKDQFIPVMLNFIGLRKGKVYSQSHVNRVVRGAAANVIVTWYERQQQRDKPTDT